MYPPVVQFCYRRKLLIPLLPVLQAPHCQVCWQLITAFHKSSQLCYIRFVALKIPLIWGVKVKHVTSLNRYFPEAFQKFLSTYCFISAYRSFVRFNWLFYMHTKIQWLWLWIYYNIHHAFLLDLNFPSVLMHNSIAIAINK